MNTLRTFFLFVALFLLLVLIGELVAGQQGMIIAFVFAGDSKQSVPQALPMQGAAQVPAPSAT